MYANAYELKMPTNYVDMNARELEYDGGWNWRKVLKIATVVAVVAVTVYYAPVVCATVAVSTGMGAIGVGAMNFAADAAIAYAIEWAVSD